MSEHPSALAALGNTLPIGFKVQNKLLSEFTIGPIKGSLRRQLLNVSSKPYPYQTLVALRHIILELGGLGLPPEALLRRLTLIDVEYLMLCISQQETTAIEVKLACEGCERPLEGRINHADVALVPGSAGVEFTKDGDPFQRLVFEDPITGRSIEVLNRVSTLGDQLRLFDKLALQRGKRDADRMGDITFEQVALTMIGFDGGPPLKVTQLDDLHYRTADALLSASRQVFCRHLDTDVEFTCENCGTKNATGLPLEGWLVPFAPTVSSKEGSQP